MSENPPISAKVQSGAFGGALPPECTSAFTYIGNAPCIAPTPAGKVHGQILPAHPLDHPGVVKIKLGASATEALTKTGEHLFAVVTDGTGEHAGHSILHVKECSKETLDLAWGIIAGTHKATRIRLPSPSLTPPTPTEPKRS